MKKKAQPKPKLRKHFKKWRAMKRKLTDADRKKIRILYERAGLGRWRDLVAE